MPFRYLHAMVRITDVARKSSTFIARRSASEELRRKDSEEGRYTLIFLVAPGDKERAIAERAPHCSSSPSIGIRKSSLKAAVSAIWPSRSMTYTPLANGCCLQAGVTINRPPRDGRAAFVRSPDNITIELLQKGAAPLPKKEPSGRPCRITGRGDIWFYLITGRSGRGVFSGACPVCVQLRKRFLWPAA